MQGLGQLQDFLMKYHAIKTTREAREKYEKNEHNITKNTTEKHAQTAIKTKSLCNLEDC